MALVVPPGPFEELGTACIIWITILIFRGKLHIAGIRIKLMLPYFISEERGRERDRDKELDL